MPLMTVDDTARRTIVTPIFEALGVRRVLTWDVDVPGPGVARDSGSTVGDTLAEALAAADSPDAISLGGYTGWHTLRRHAAEVVRYYRCHGGSPPVVVIEGPPLDPWPSWAKPQPHAAVLQRAESTKDGVRIAARELAQQLPWDATSLWHAPGRGLAAMVPAWAAKDLHRLLSSIASELEELNAAHSETAELALQQLKLFDTLERAHVAATALVQSRRFRYGDRLARSTRRVLLKRAGTLPAEVEIRRLASVIDRWRTQLTAATPRVPRTGALRVTYVLPQLAVAGGTFGVSQLVNELTLLGADARIVTLQDKPPVYRWRFLDKPTVFSSLAELLARLPETDILVATHWSTASWVHELVRRGRAKHSVYFLQDYEPWFFPESDAKAREIVRHTFALIPHKIVKSDWLANLLENDGHAVKKIPLGLDLGFFYPRVVASPSHAVVIAMARPRTPRRGFDSVVAALAKVKQVMPSAEIVLFGQDLRDFRVPFPYRGEGEVTDQEHLARLYSGAHVHLDGSDFQAFGRPALEAMACGAACVLTEVGGVSEYARHGQNCLLVPPRSPDAFADAILRLLRDEDLREQLRSGGLETVLDYSSTREARDTLTFFEEIAGSPETA